MKLILIDDERNFEDIKWIHYNNVSEVVVLRTFKQFKEYIDKLETIENLFFTFDHDLQDFYNKPYSNSTYEYTGLDCVKYLIDCIIDSKFHIKDFKYVAHTMNPIGKQNIESYIESYKRYYDLG